MPVTHSDTHANRSDEVSPMAEKTSRYDFFVGKAALVGLDPGVNIGWIVDNPAAQLGIAGPSPVSRIRLSVSGLTPR